MNTKNIHHHADELVTQLPVFAKFLIDPAQRSFIANPDGVEEHFPRWHEFGIITHTAKVLSAFRDETPAILNRWGMTKIHQDLAVATIDGLNKWQLFELSIPLHDVGKFKRILISEKTGSRADFSGHEALSERIVLDNSEVRGVLSKMGLSDNQVIYIARLCGLHFELGKARDVAHAVGGYSIEFARSDAAKKVFAEIAAANAPYAAEVGIYFLVDSIGKISLRPEMSSDLERKDRRAEIEQTLNSAGKGHLADAVLQYPVNFEISRCYLAAL